MIAPPVVILAGGLSRRMQGPDKPTMLLAGRPMLAHVIDRLAPQTEALAINANGPAGDYALFGLPVLPDVVAGRPGPLAGILTAMRWAKGHDAVVTVPADAPFLPGDLIPRLLMAAEGPVPRAVIAASGGRHHPVVGLWPVAMTATLEQAIDDGMRRVRDWADLAGAVVADFPATDPDPFFNVNTPEDLDRAAASLARG